MRWLKDCSEPSKIKYMYTFTTLAKCRIKIISEDIQEMPQSRSKPFLGIKRRSYEEQ